MPPRVLEPWALAPGHRQATSYSGRFDATKLTGLRDDGGRLAAGRSAARTAASGHGQTSAGALARRRRGRGGRRAEGATATASRALPWHVEGRRVAPGVASHRLCASARTSSRPCVGVQDRRCSAAAPGQGPAGTAGARRAHSLSGQRGHVRPWGLGRSAGEDTGGVEGRGGRRAAGSRAEGGRREGVDVRSLLRPAGRREPRRSPPWTPAGRWP